MMVRIVKKVHFKDFFVYYKPFVRNICLSWQYYVAAGSWVESQTRMFGGGD